LIVTGSGDKSGFKTSYRLGEEKVSDEVKGDGLTTDALGPGESATIRLQVKAKKNASKGKKGTWKISMRSIGDESVSDTVKAKAKVR
jgi:hypothetical protein